MSLVVLGAAALVQAIVFLATGSVALLADLVHNVGDAATALPLGIAFFLRSERGERFAGYVVVAVIFVSALFTLCSRCHGCSTPRTWPTSARSPPRASSGSPGTRSPRRSASPTAAVSAARRCCRRLACASPR
jgi:hypothetical protein